MGEYSGWRDKRGKKGGRKGLCLVFVWGGGRKKHLWEATKTSKKGRRCMEREKEGIGMDEPGMALRENGETGMGLL